MRTHTYHCIEARQNANEMKATMKGCDMNLVVVIEGREAIPVRAIPYVTGWRWPRGISPDSLAKTLGRHPNERTPFDGLRTSSAYKMYLGKSVAVRPEEWNMVVVQLEGFSADLEARFPEDEQGRRDARGYAAWQSNAAQKLPSGVFVWLDELEKDFHRYFDWKARQVPADSLGSRDLNLAPLLLTDDVRRMVSEGFEEFTGIHGNPSAKDRALASDGATANDGDRAIKLEAMLEQQNDPTHGLMVNYSEAVCTRNERALGRKSLIESADDENTISGILRKESELLIAREEHDQSDKAHRQVRGDFVTQTQDTTQSPAPVEDVGVSDRRIRYEVLASRTELIDAFSLYGVELKLFRALKDRPGLYAARRVKGQGKRGSNAEPMFCPYEAMNWLVKTGVKGKPKLSSFTAWRILETKFPNVYAEKSIGDPRSN